MLKTKLLCALGNQKIPVTHCIVILTLLLCPGTQLQYLQGVPVLAVVPPAVVCMLFSLMPQVFTHVVFFACFLLCFLYMENSYLQLWFSSSDTLSLISSSWGTCIYFNSHMNLFPLVIYTLFTFAFLTSSELSDMQWEPNIICWMNRIN